MALSRASISTLHRFCGSLLREHFQALAIDPGFRIGDEQECGVLSRSGDGGRDFQLLWCRAATRLPRERTGAMRQEELGELALRAASVHDDAPRYRGRSSARAQETVRLTGEAFERSPAARTAGGFCGAEAGAPLRASARRDAGALRGGKRRAALRGGLRHGCAADGGYWRRRRRSGYAALHDALHGVTFAALGRKKKTDLLRRGYRRPGEGAARRAQKGRRGCADGFCADAGGRGGGYPHDGRAAGRAGRAGRQGPITTRSTRRPSASAA